MENLPTRKSSRTDLPDGLYSRPTTTIGLADYDRYRREPDRKKPKQIDTLKYL